MQSKTYSSVGCSQTIFENHLAEVQQEKKKKWPKMVESQALTKNLEGPEEFGFCSESN